MAISDSFNLNNALNSQAYAYKCWYNYNYGNNTMGISAKDMGEITQTWNGELNNWHATALDDENAYEIEDDDFSTAKMNGKNTAKADTKEASGYEGGTGKMITRGVVDGTAGVVNALGTTVLSKTANKVAQPIAEKLMGKGTVDKLGEGGTIEQQGKSGWIITAPLALATGTKYTTSKPNKEEKEACAALQNTMTESQSALTAAQSDMSDMGDEITALSDEAQANNEDANDEIEDNKSEYDTYKASYDALVEKAQSGETLTEDEKALLQELVTQLQELGVNINEIQEETTETTEDIYDDMSTYQEGYDNAAETVAEVQGVTDYAESFDSTTQKMCYVEAGAQTLNAASGTKAAVQAGKFAASGGLFTSWAWAFSAMGVAGAAQSGIGAAQQFQWAGEVGTEITLRKEAQDLNSATSDIYNESIENYDGWMTGVEELELEMPKDLEDMDSVTEEINAGAETALGSGAGADSGLGASGLGTAGAASNSGTTATAGGTTSTGNTNQKDKDEKEI